MGEHEPDRRAELRQEIVKRQGELEEALLELREVVEGGLARFDLRARVTEAPLAWLAGGFMLGLVLGMRRR